MMPFNKVAIVTSAKSWFNDYVDELKSSIEKDGVEAEIFPSHNQVTKEFECVFLVSYFSLVEEAFLKQFPWTFVVHESALPKGKGWAPLFWQILEGKNEIPIVLIQATREMDAGDIYLEDTIQLNGDELHDEIRQKQAQKTIELCSRLVKSFDEIEPQPQRGKETFYPKRKPKDSELSVDKSIKEQFNLLRIVNNESFPAFFYIDGRKYVLTIKRDD